MQEKKVVKYRCKTCFRLYACVIGETAIFCRDCLAAGKECVWELDEFIIKEQGTICDFCS